MPFKAGTVASTLGGWGRKILNSGPARYEHVSGWWWDPVWRPWAQSLVLGIAYATFVSFHFFLITVHFSDKIPLLHSTTRRTFEIKIVEFDLGSCPLKCCLIPWTIQYFHLTDYKYCLLATRIVIKVNTHYTEGQVNYWHYNKGKNIPQECLWEITIANTHEMLLLPHVLCSVVYVLLLI